MIRGTTLPITLTVDDADIDFTAADSVYATIAQGKIETTKSDDELEISAQSVVMTLTQAESLSYKFGVPAYAQINWLYTDEKNIQHRAATEVGTVIIGQQICDEVIS